MVGDIAPSSRLNRLRPVVSGARFPVIVTGGGVSNPSFSRPSRASAYTTRQDAERLCLKNLKDDPYSLWQLFLAYRRSMRRTGPNAAHKAIVEFAKRLHAGVVINLNIDGLLEELSTERVLPLRGSIWRNQCEHCGTTRVDPLYEPSDSDGISYYLPTCPRCKRMERPDVLLRDELIDLRYEDPLAYAVRALAEADVIVLAGVSLQDCPEPLLTFFRPLTTSRNGTGGIGGKFTIEIASETEVFVSDSSLIGKLEYLVSQLLAP